MCAGCVCMWFACLKWKCWLCLFDLHGTKVLLYIALAFSIFKTSGPRKQRLRPVDQENKGNWQWRSTLDSKGRSHFISQGLQFGHKQSNFKIFSLQVIRNVFLKNNCIKINFMMYSSNTVHTKVNLFEFITEHNKILILIQQFDLFFSVI